MNPDTASESPEWQQIKAQFPIGWRVRGTVTKCYSFGMLVDLGGATGLIAIIDVADEGRVTEQMFPPVGSAVEAVVLQHMDELRKQIRLSMKPSVLRDAK